MKTAPGGGEGWRMSTLKVKVSPSSFGAMRSEPVRVVTFDGTAGGARDAAPEEVAALPESRPPPGDACAFAQFDAQGLSPLERVLAEW